MPGFCMGSVVICYLKAVDLDWLGTLVLVGMDAQGLAWADALGTKPWLWFVLLP